MPGTPGDDVLNGTSGDDIIDGLGGNDQIRGLAGDDTLNGDEDHDNLRGGDDDDTLNGGTGDDYLRGGEGDDAIDGGDGFDRAAYTVLTNNPDGGETGVQVGATVDLNLQGVAQDTGHGLDVLSGIEHVSGTAYADTLTGDGGDNWIWGEGGNDTLSGGGGNDLVETDAGNSTLDGGLGNDTAGFQGLDSFTSGVSVSLALQGSAQTVAAGSGITLSGFENLTGTSHDDMLSGDGGDNILAGSGGDDILFGGAGADTLYGDGRIAADTHGTGGSGPITVTADASGLFDPTLVSFDDILDGGSGDDILNGGAGSDTASFASSSDAVTVGLGPAGNGFADHEGGEIDQLFSIENVTGSAFSDSILGNNDANVLDGGAGGDALFGRGGDDRLIGGEGDDFLRGSDGADTLDGGNGWDRVSSFVPAPTAGISFDLNIQGVAQDTGQGLDVLIGIEHASGTVLNDTLTGNGGSNWLWDGSDGDHATVATGDDTISAGAGDDLVEVGAGNDTLSGGTGIDALSFLGGRVEISSAGVTYSLALQGAAQATEQGSMNTSGFENVSGSLFDDVLTGDTGANILAGDLGSDSLSGGDGDDSLYGDGRIWVDISGGVGGSGPITLFGQVEDEAGFNPGDPDFTSGNDTLNGGKGDDDLYGGRGNDTMTGGLQADRFIIEADSGDDVITDFKGVDTIVFDPSSGVDEFSDLTLTAAPGNSTLISWGTGDSILVQGVKPHQLGASDFEFGSAAFVSLADFRGVPEHGSFYGMGHGGTLAIGGIDIV